MGKGTEWVEEGKAYWKRGKKREKDVGQLEKREKKQRKGQVVNRRKGETFESWERALTGWMKGKVHWRRKMKDVVQLKKKENKQEKWIV